MLQSRPSWADPSLTVWSGCLPAQLPAPGIQLPQPTHCFFIKSCILYVICPSPCCGLGLESLRLPGNPPNQLKVSPSGHLSSSGSSESGAVLPLLLCSNLLFPRLSPDYELHARPGPARMR